MTSETATSETVPSPPSEDEMGSHLSRLVKPFVLAAPLMVIALAPAALYGRRSRDVAADADRALVDALVTADDGSAVSIDPEILCDASAVTRFRTAFNELDLGGDNHKASVSGIGFDAVIVDLKGRVDEPSGPDKDDIRIRLERADGEWCVAGVETLVAGSG